MINFREKTLYINNMIVVIDKSKEVRIFNNSYKYIVNRHRIYKRAKEDYKRSPNKHITTWLECKKTKQTLFLSTEELYFIRTEITRFDSINHA